MKEPVAGPEGAQKSAIGCTRTFQYFSMVSVVPVAGAKPRERSTVFPVAEYLAEVIGTVVAEVKFAVTVTAHAFGSVNARAGASANNDNLMKRRNDRHVGYCFAL
ncbi:MAG: hypothetical protein NTW21_27270 [Verrucomicrobia bacterium]|nr:hypothetical protein [Verrucomicrobiota bacterium]